MLQLSRWKIALVALSVVFGVLFTLPNLVPNGTLPGWMPQKRLNLGLDLQGGSSLLLEVDTAALKAEQLGNTLEDARTALQAEHIVSQIGIVNGQVNIRLADPAQTTAALTEMRKLNRPLPSGGSSLDIRGADGVVTLAIPDKALTEESVRAVQKSIEIVRRRIDKLGTREPSIVQQGATRILVEAPGESDPERLQRVIGQTAKLTFQLVDLNVTPADMAANRIPPEDVVVASSDGRVPTYVLRRKVIVSGEMLQSASGEFSQQSGQPVVTFRFNADGARKFGEVTRQNIGRPFAIVLDNKVISAPNIQSAIEGGTGEITGNFTLKTATEMGLLLSSGALPAPLKVIEQRTVGAQLGADAVKAGQTSVMIGAALIFIFIILAYGLFGWFAAIALMVNGLLIVAFMSLTQATLTLPGIAGLILTLAVAVDANVLIYERARDESRAGRAPMAAMDHGYTHAMGTIIDANLTSLIAALIMFQFGSGPVRGFAWTLSIGIATSVFTSVLITQVLIGWWLRSAKPKQLPISEVA